MTEMIQGFLCQSCGQPAPKRGAMQKYCVPCSESQHRDRGRRNTAVARPKIKSALIKSGIQVSAETARESLSGGELFLADDGWMCGFKVPFTIAASKNHVWSMAGNGGHVFKRQQSRQFQDVVAHKVKAACRGLTVFQNKIWIDLFVQKPHNKADAINVVDLVCDGIKVGLGIDDRWFCIRQLDWEIAKTDPQIFIKIFQRDTFDAIACSHCGRILGLENFRKKKGTKLGTDRVCKECHSRSSAMLTAERAEVLA
jgi:hypothetical protein